ncbi:HD-GYP domain-containing protein, partial [Streptomyces albidus (ex Kaewkla and Franco 2022)]|uniref:HD-GYP domain-containing protein n=1 Tax=Streptomyces albidus (ex Kaewkla and Franco 2022) TaxID=722709 RepID=UPI0015EEDB69
CVVVTALDGAVLAVAERCALRAAWRGQFSRAAAPHLLHGLVGLMMAVLWRSPYGPVAAFFVLLPMYICCWVFAQYHRERGAHQSTIRALVQAVDIKDRYTRGHSERVGRASVLIARELGMDEERTEALRFAGILHDVGKLGVPTRVLRKEGPLTDEERRVIELHPEYGHEMVRGIGFLGEARSAILHHHERLDGSGYPYGLAGAEIPEFARVVAVADAFDAMTSTRSYRRARPVRTAVAELQRCAGTQFDPRMVGALASALDRQGWSPAVTADGPGGNVPGAREQSVNGAEAGALAASDEVNGPPRQIGSSSSGAHAGPTRPRT